MKCETSDVCFPSNSIRREKVCVKTLIGVENDASNAYEMNFIEIKLDDKKNNSDFVLVQAHSPQDTIPILPFWHNDNNIDFHQKSKKKW